MSTTPKPEIRNSGMGVKASEVFVPKIPGERIEIFFGKMLCTTKPFWSFNTNPCDPVFRLKRCSDVCNECIGIIVCTVADLIDDRKEGTTR